MGVVSIVFKLLKFQFGTQDLGTQNSQLIYTSSDKRFFKRWFVIA